MPKEIKKKQNNTAAPLIDPEDALDTAADIETPEAGAIQTVSDEALNPGDIPNLDQDAPEMEEPEDLTANAEAELEFKLEPMTKSEMPQAIIRPKVIGGICEACGIFYKGKWVYDRAAGGYRRATKNDKPQNIVSCKHYGNLELVCGYCRNSERTLERTLFVYSLPERPNVLITCCDDFKCNEMHKKRFERQINVTEIAE